MSEDRKGKPPPVEDDWVQRCKDADKERRRTRGMERGVPVIEPDKSKEKRDG